MCVRDSLQQFAEIQFTKVRTATLQEPIVENLPPGFTITRVFYSRARRRIMLRRKMFVLPEQLLVEGFRPFRPMIRKILVNTATLNAYHLAVVKQKTWLVWDVP